MPGNRYIRQGRRRTTLCCGGSTGHCLERPLNCKNQTISAVLLTITPWHDHLASITRLHDISCTLANEAWLNRLPKTRMHNISTTATNVTFFLGMRIRNQGHCLSDGGQLGWMAGAGNPLTTGGTPLRARPCTSALAAESRLPPSSVCRASCRGTHIPCGGSA